MRTLRTLVALAGVVLLLAAISNTWAQLTVLHQFGGVLGDGDSPRGSLTLDGSTLYGTCGGGGSNGFGTVFRINTDGTGYTNLHLFAAGQSDGALPVSLILGGSTLYGTTSGDSFGWWGDHWGILAGTVFRINTDGSGYTNLHFFVGGPGSGSVTLDGSTLYGTYSVGGLTTVDAPLGMGTVFKINTDGSGYTNLYFFGSMPGDGTTPSGPPTLNGSTLYGTCGEGGDDGYGTVFRINTDGNGYITLHSFAGGVGDGAGPGPLTLDGSTLYGTCSEGGRTTVDAPSGRGTVFQINTDGSGYTTLYFFGRTPGSGAGPNGSLALIGSKLYGMTTGGGRNGLGTVFHINTDGSGYANLYVFTPSDGADNYFSPTVVGSTLYGETGSGGSYSNGTVFELAVGGGGCTFTLKATSVNLRAKGGSKTVKVKTHGTDCAWTAVSNDSFITITSGSSGTGNGTVRYSVPGNTNTVPLTGTMTIAGQTFTVNQAAGGCTFKLSPKAGKIKAIGGSATVKIKPNFSDCAWTAVSNDSFITITDGASGVGKGTVSYTVAANASTNVLAGTMTIAGQTYIVTQAAAK